jgi:hypothetical protein
MFKNKTLVIVVAVVILALLGGAAYLTLSKSTTAPGTTSQNTTEQTSGNSEKNTTLAGLLALGQNLRCSFNVEGEAGASTQGTFYVSGGNVRGDFTTKTAGGKEDKMNMLRKGNDNYIWGGSLPMGIKMTISLEEFAGTAKTNQYASQSVDPNKEYDYNCAPWTPDASLFTPPADVKFTDMSAMMPKASGAPVKGAGGFSCAGIADASAKAECEALLKSQTGGY